MLHRLVNRVKNSHKENYINGVSLPRIFDMLELCISGQAFKIFLRSSLAHTMNAFIGRLICGLFSPSRFCCLTILAEERKREIEKQGR